MHWPDRPIDQSIEPKNVADAAHEPSAAPVRTPMVVYDYNIIRIQNIACTTLPVIHRRN